MTALIGISFDMERKTPPQQVLGGAVGDGSQSAV
jgi:hypothetical protein